MSNLGNPIDLKAGDAPAQIDLPGDTVLEAQTDIKIRVASTSNTNTTISAAFDLLLVG